MLSESFGFCMSPLLIKHTQEFASTGRPASVSWQLLLFFFFLFNFFSILDEFHFLYPSPTHLLSLLIHPPPLQPLEHCPVEGQGQLSQAHTLRATPRAHATRTGSTVLLRQGWGRGDHSPEYCNRGGTGLAFLCISTDCILKLYFPTRTVYCRPDPD